MTRAVRGPASSEGEIEAARRVMQASQPHDRATRLRYNDEELVDQPRAIRETLAVEAERIMAVGRVLAAQARGRVYGLGCGDSWAVCQALKEPFERLLGRPFEAHQALEFVRFGSRFVGAGDVVLGLSASGTTAETLRGLTLAQTQGAFTIGVTNTPDSPLTRQPDIYLLGHARRRASFPTQASTVELAALLAVAVEAARVRGGDAGLIDVVTAWLDGLPGLVEGIIQQAAPHAAALASQTVRQGVFPFVGAGPGLAAAMFGAAKIREGCDEHAYVIGTEEFHHYDIPRPGEWLFLVAPLDEAYARAVDVARAVHAAGGLLVSVTPDEEQTIAGLSAVAFRVPSGPAYLAGLPYTIPLQVAAWHIARAKLDAGWLSETTT